jgi:hypothetical protein
MYTNTGFSSRKKLRQEAADGTLAWYSLPRRNTIRTNLVHRPAPAAFALARSISCARLAVGTALLLAGVALGACAPPAPEDPARVALRGRLAQEARLSEEEIARLSEEVERTMEGKALRITDQAGTRAPDQEQRDEVFRMLRNRAGVYDEGLRREGGTLYRVLNGPGRSDNAEIEATERLWVDVQTLVPRRYQFSYAFAGYGDYAYDLSVGP